VLAQRQIPNKGSEIHEVAPLVADLDLTGRVVTFDALHTQRATAEHLVGVKNADYLMTVKANQPTCSLPAKPPCPGRPATSPPSTPPVNAATAAPPQFGHIDVSRLSSWHDRLMVWRIVYAVVRAVLGLVVLRRRVERLRGSTRVVGWFDRFRSPRFSCQEDISMLSSCYQRVQGGSHTVGVDAVGQSTGDRCSAQLT
jgi:hypothetical protein